MDASTLSTHMKLIMHRTMMWNRFKGQRSFSKRAVEHESHRQNGSFLGLEVQAGGSGESLYFLKMYWVKQWVA